MKKIKSYITNLPKGVKIILSINLIVYLISILFDSIFSVNITKILGVYATNDDRFHFYQIITSIFTHDLFYTHILLNIVFLLVFASNVENKIGTKNFIILYLFSGIIASITCNLELIQRYSDIISSYENYKPYDYYDKIGNEILLKDNLSDNISYGASGSIFGIMLSYLLLNLLTIRKIVFNLIVIFFVFVTIRLIFTDIDKEGLPTFLNHFGGMIGGTLFTIAFLIFKSIKNGVRVLTP